MVNISELEELIQQAHEVLEKSKKTTIYSPIGKFLLKVRQKNKSLSDADFTVLVAEAFRLTPQAKFMAYVYPDLMKGIRKVLGGDKVEEMIKSIMKKYSFYDGESVLYEFDGRVILRVKGGIQISYTKTVINSARIYMTDQRIIVHGSLSQEKFKSFVLGGGAMSPTDKVRRQQKLIGSEEKSCFGFEMPIKPIEQIIRNRNEINYIAKPKDEIKQKSTTFNIRLIPEDPLNDLDKIESILNSNQ